MKKSILIASLLLLALANTTFAKYGYKINIKIAGLKDSTAYLVHYYGKPLPTIYKRDSTKFNSKGVAIFESNDSNFVGGIYMLLLSDRKTYFEFLLDNGDDFSISTTMKNVQEDITFKNSPTNDLFKEYVDFLKGYSRTQEGFKKELSQAKNTSDSQAVRKKAISSSKELTLFRKNIAAKNPNTLLSSIFHALETPVVPEGDHYLADGKTKDTTFPFAYYKSHYWDGYNLQDERLIHTPILDSKLEEYFNKLVVQWPDSVNHEADMLLKKAKGTKENFKYVLWWLTRFTENSKIMGMDESFVHLIESYYMKGDAYWLSSDELSKFTDRAMKIAPNVIGNVAPEVKLRDIFTKNTESLVNLKAKYTLLVFYSPDCNHCQKELPSIDSLYELKLKKLGVKVYTVATEAEDSKIAEFLVKNKLEKWINTSDPEHTGDWRGKYDVYSTPSIYLLDEKKIIRGKRLDHTNILEVIEMLENDKKINKKN